MEKRTVLKNICCSLLLQICTIISGFIIPKIILVYFGSSVNGLISSINQFLNYISLLEGGLSGVVMASLYKPLLERDYSKISGIINATSAFFRKIGFVYIIYMICIAFIYPRVVDCDYSNTYISVLVIVLGLNLLIQYFFSLTYKLLINADRKVYFVSLTQILIVLGNTVFTIIAAKVFNDVIIIKLFSAIVFLIQPVFYVLYVRKNYSLDKTVPKDNEALKQRWNGFGQNLAYFIHTNTDVVILTIFTSLSEVSVYSVYLLVVNALKNLVISISSAVAPSIGNIMAKGRNDEINRAFDIYEFAIDFISTLLFSCGIVLLTPFIKIYTAEINDADYVRPLFGIILALAEMVYCFRDPYVSVAYAAGHFKETSKYAYFEAAINIIFSLIMVRKFGVIGVALGTLISMIYRMVAHVLYLQQYILMRDISKFIKKVIVFGICIISSVIVSAMVYSVNMTNYFQWIGAGFVLSVSYAVVLVILGLIFFREEMDYLIGSKIKKQNR